MSTLAEVKLWGEPVGAVSFQRETTWPRSSTCPGFAEGELEVAPLTMTLRERDPFRFPELAERTFKGLSGLLADSLPDRYGNA